MVSRRAGMWQTHLYLKELLRQQVMKLAEREHRSMTQQLEVLVEEALETLKAK